MTHNPPFLSLAADFYSHKPNLTDYCFVFPNRRSGQFFINHLKNTTSGITVLPDAVTIADFLSSITKQNPISSVEALFLLFSCYKEIDESVEFDKFAYWGDMLLNDFNDIDTYMVDAKDLFTNVKDTHNIATDYIDDELRNSLDEFFKSRINFSQANGDRFWCTDPTDADADNVRTRFVHMWSQLYNLYTAFNNRLNAANLSYTGKMYRDAVAKIADIDASQFPHRHYVFIGFNILSTSQIAIFKSLKQKGIAEFLWDFNSPAFNVGENKGAKFISFYKKLFPNPPQFAEQPITTFPSITVTGVPSNIGQTKYAISIVNKLIEGKTGSQLSDTLNNTAIVLPDENLFIPLVNSIGTNITDTNITLGYPLRSSSVMSLMRCIAKAHRRASFNKTTSKWSFLRDDVLNILSHPIIKTKHATLAITLSNDIIKGNAYKVDQATLLATPLAPLFLTVDSTPSGISSYLDRLIAFAQSIKVNPDTNDTPDADTTPTLHDAFINAYVDVLTQLKTTMAAYGLSTNSLSTIFHLIDKLAGMHMVPFEGEPLKGLQIMGVLETRCLDFKNVIILSMNDGTFPQKHIVSPSFISESLRRSFHMSNSDDQEAMPTYYFYRLISRAQHVDLIYNSGAGDSSEGEISRFITQLQKIYNCPITQREATGQIKPANEMLISIRQGDLLKRYFDTTVPKGDNEDFRKCTISASAINTYISCPLKFYFHYVQHLNDDNALSDFMDASTKGTVVHNVLQSLYEPKVPGTPKVVTMLDILTFAQRQLNAEIRRQINTVFLHADTPDEPLTGEAQITADPLMQYVRRALNFDLKQLDPNASINDNIPTDPDQLMRMRQLHFQVFECESSHYLRLPVTDQHGDTIAVNLNIRADRIDRINGTGPIRLIDYKTGSDKTTIKSIDALFQDEHAILQQFIYANAYLHLHPEVSEIQPMLYTVKSEDIIGIFHNKQQVVISRDNPINTQFLNKFHDFLATMRNPDIAFIQAEKPTSQFGKYPCRYCNFTDFCRR